MNRYKIRIIIEEYILGFTLEEEDTLEVVDIVDYMFDLKGKEKEEEK